MFLILAGVLCWGAGLSVSSTVNQTPSALPCTSGSPAEFKCRHQIKTCNVILWYQQSAGEGALKLVGNVYYAENETEDL
ncbi:hypothetical protein GN956_G27051 [Arapaima gigas]